MSIDLLHAGPRLMASLLIVVVALAIAALAADRRPPLWLLVAVASLADTLVAVLLSPHRTARTVTWTVLMTLTWATIPVTVGAWRLARVAGPRAASVRGYVVSLVVGLSVGWLLVPFVVGVIGVSVLALTARVRAA